MAMFLNGNLKSLDLFSIIPKRKTYGILGRLAVEIEYRRLSFLDMVNKRQEGSVVVALLASVMTS